MKMQSGATAVRNARVVGGQSREEDGQMEDDRQEKVKVAVVWENRIDAWCVDETHSQDIPVRRKAR